MTTLVELIVVLVVGPALLAMWVDARYPKLRPSELRRTAIHIGLIGLIAFVLLRPTLLLVAALLHGPAGEAISFTVATTAITYGLVVSLWTMRNAADIARAHR